MRRTPTPRLDRAFTVTVGSFRVIHTRAPELSFRSLFPGDKPIKSLREIKIEFWEKRLKKDAEVRTDFREAEHKLNALLQEAGTGSLPQRYTFEALFKGEDEADYRQRVREMVFEVRDVRQRKQIIAQIQHVFHGVPEEAQEMLRLFDDQFLTELIDKRSRPPRVTNSLLVISAIPLAVICLAISNWFGGIVDVLIVGLGIVLPGTLFVALHRIGELHRYDVIMQEAIRDIEGQITQLRVGWKPHPEFFSRLEATTGEADKVC